MPDYLFIGDVHSQNDSLVRALDYARSESLVPVLLGDVFDSRCDIDQTLEVFQTIWEYPKNLPFLMVNSNHQWKLLGYYLGKRKVSPDIAKTAIKLLPYKSMIIPWFSSLPYGIGVTSETHGDVYRIAHAYFPSKYGAKTLVTRGDTNAKARGLFLYGPRKEGNTRKEWWKDQESLERPWIRVAGHYHNLFIGKNSLVLDGGCGDPKGTLVSYDTRNKTLFY